MTIITNQIKMLKTTEYIGIQSFLNSFPMYGYTNSHCYKFQFKT